MHLVAGSPPTLKVTLYPCNVRVCLTELRYMLLSTFLAASEFTISKISVRTLLF